MIEPYPHDRTQSHHHRGPNECQEGFCHPEELPRMEAFSFRHNALYHMKSNQPNHLFGRNDTFDEFIRLLVGREKMNEEKSIILIR